MTARDDLLTFLGRQRPPLGAEHLHAMTVTTPHGQVTIGAREALDLLDDVPNTNSLNDSVFFRYAETADDVFIRPVGTGNNWETFNPRAALTVADIT